MTSKASQENHEEAESPLQTCTGVAT